MKKILALVALAVLYLAHTGCTTVPETGVTGAGDEAQAIYLFQRERYTDAAQAYGELARQSDGPTRLRYLLRQVAALARADRLAQAWQIYRAIEPDLESVPVALRVLTLAQLSLAERKPEQVLELLAQPLDATAPPELQAEYHSLRAGAFTMLGQRLENSRELVARGFYLLDPELQLQNQQAIWASLATLTERSLQQLRVAPPPDVLSGWMELVALAKKYQLRPQLLQQELARWRTDYPNHPVRPELLEGLMSRKQEDVTYPDHIALILPLSSRYARAAEAIRDGFLSAYYEHRPRQDQQIRIYDIGSDPTNVHAVYQRAVAAGAQFVVGPLSKEATDALAREGELPVPTLALNYTSAEDVPANLYQFSLSPEEEARQVAQRTWLDGHVYALALVPSGPWGERVFNAFRTRWEELGGTLLEHQRYNATDNDFSLPIKRLLDIDDSRRRYRRLHTLLKRNLKYTPRRRKDVDFVFIAAYPRQARQIRPQLKFFHAADLPVYATSHVFTGNLNREKDRDMDGLYFGDMPWVLAESRSHSGLRNDIEPYISSVGRSLQRLFALGIDAFNIIAALNPLRAYPYERFDGETGSLSLDERNRIHRQLTWVRFRSGQPVLIDESGQ
ncbi:MAG TPA: penicillin-binding protein activator [Gammaproteobacteria bacterium]|nr:penicillin-binding protein activator [Gammaproteobacteria bacterium]